MRIESIEWVEGKEHELQRIIENIASIRDRTGFIYLYRQDTLAISIEELEAIASGLRGDLWHGGVSDGFDFLWNKFIQPCWMLDIIPDLVDDFVSWQMDARSALIPLWLFDLVGYPRNEFRSVEVSFLDWSYRLVRSGGIPLNSKILRQAVSHGSNKLITTDQELRFVKRNYSNFWSHWTVYRAIMNNKVSLPEGFQVWRRLKQIRKEAIVKIERDLKLWSGPIPSISVVVITLDRYPYLLNTINQLLKQIVVPEEIIVVDATSIDRRTEDWKKEIPNTNVPIKIFYSGIIGQCTQRNLGISQAKGKYIYFCDDDMDEIEPDHLLRHVTNIKSYGADASCGMPDEVGAMILNRESIPISVSTVFPTNDSLISLAILKQIGCFDVRMDRGQSEDHELGIRVYKAGGLILLDPSIRALHLRANFGGLRNSNVRKVTRESSRTQIFHFRLPHTTELFLYLKHYSFDRVSELIIIMLTATIRFNKRGLSGLIKSFVGAIMLPYHFVIIKRRTNLAKVLLSNPAD